MIGNIIFILVIWGIGYAIWNWIKGLFSTGSSSVNNSSSYNNQFQGEDVLFYYKVTIDFVDSHGYGQTYTNTYGSDRISGAGAKSQAKSELKSMADVSKITNIDVKDVTRAMKRSMRH